MNDNGSVNKVFLTGEIVRAPRWHKSSTDGLVLCFSLTTRETYRQQNRLIEHVEEHAIKLPEKRFETDLKVGQTVHVEGKLKTTSSVGEQNHKQYKTEIIALRITLFK